MVARVAELADAPDLGSGALGRGGSSPLSRTTFFISILHAYQIYLTGALIFIVPEYGITRCSSEFCFI